MKILVLRNELERQKKALDREVTLLHKEQGMLFDRGECKWQQVSHASHAGMSNRGAFQSVPDGRGPLAKKLGQQGCTFISLLYLTKHPPIDTTYPRVLCCEIQSHCDTTAILYVPQADCIL